SPISFKRRHALKHTRTFPGHVDIRPVFCLESTKLKTSAPPIVHTDAVWNRSHTSQPPTRHPGNTVPPKPRAKTKKSRNEPGNLNKTKENAPKNSLKTPPKTPQNSLQITRFHPRNPDLSPPSRPATCPNQPQPHPHPDPRPLNWNFNAHSPRSDQHHRRRHRGKRRPHGPSGPYRSRSRSRTGRFPGALDYGLPAP